MKVLFICTHNRCRSILSEAITNHYSNGIIEARSAGSQPCGEVHPLTLKYLAHAGINTAELSSKSWDDMESFAPDLVITVCDSAAGEVCPVWFGNTLKAHWRLTDPSANQGSEKDRAEAFQHTMRIIEQRVETLINIAMLPKRDWKDHLKAAGAEL